MRVLPYLSYAVLPLLLISPSDSTGQGTWSKIAPDGRWYAAAAHDPALNEMFVFGGFTEGGSGVVLAENPLLRLPLNGIGSWSWVPTSGGPPSTRGGASLVCDTDRNRLILFGGVDSWFLNDVWALDLATHVWSRLLPSGAPPTARAFHTAIYDPGQERMVVFGGYDEVTPSLNDTWELTLSGPPAWSPLVTAGAPPDPRYSHSAVFDPQGRMLVFGGWPGTGTWQLTLPVDAGIPTWSPLATVGAPPARWGHAAVFDEASDRMIVFGGRENCGGQTCPLRTNDVWILSLPTLQWTHPGIGSSPANYVPAPREYPVAVYDAVHERLVVFAGSGGRRENYHGGHILGDTWSLPFDTTLQWKALTPPSRALSAVAYDEVRHRMIVFGGQNRQGALGDLWTYDPTPPGHWTQIVPSGPAPWGRVGATLVHDVANDRFLVFGGEVGFALNDLWAFAPNPPTWTQLFPTGDPPSARWGHVAVVDQAGGRMIVYGGTGANDTWTLTLNGPPVWSQQLGPNPSPRYGHSAVFDPVHWDDPTVGHMIVFGGFGSLSDTHDWIASQSPSWNPLPAGSPPGRAFAASAYDGIRDQMLLFGGSSGETALNDFWVLPFYDTKEWSQQFPGGIAPLPRDGAGAVYDPLLDRMFVLGGFTQGGSRVFSEFWQLDRSDVPVGIGDQPAIELRVGPIRPNPSRGRVRLDVELPHASGVQLAVFDIVGRRIQLSTRSLPAGRHGLEWDGRVAGGVRSGAGIYLAHVKVEGREHVRRFVLLD